MNNNNNESTESTASTAAHPATTASAPITTTTVSFENNAPVESNGTAILVPAILEAHPINVGDMPAPTHDMRKCAIRGCPRFPDPPCIMEECAFAKCTNSCGREVYDS